VYYLQLCELRSLADRRREDRSEVLVWNRADMWAAPVTELPSMTRYATGHEDFPPNSTVHDGHVDSEAFKYLLLIGAEGSDQFLFF
jgi:hypothetical protein